MIELLDDVADGPTELRRLGMEPSAWTAEPDEVFPPHHHAQTKYLYVTSGSIAFDSIDLVIGRGIRIEAGTEHSAVAGPNGASCVEAFL